MPTHFTTFAVVPAPAHRVWSLVHDVRRYLTLWSAQLLESVEPASPRDPWRLGAGATVQATTVLFGGTQPVDPAVLTIVRADEPSLLLEMEVILPRRITARQIVSCRPSRGELCRVDLTCDVLFAPGWQGRLTRFMARTSLAELDLNMHRVMRSLQRDAVEIQEARRRTLEAIKHDYRGWDALLEEPASADILFVAWRGRPLLHQGDTIEVALFRATAPHDDPTSRPRLYAEWQPRPAGRADGLARIHIRDIVGIGTGSWPMDHGYGSLLMRGLSLVADQLHADEVVGTLPAVGTPIHDATASAHGLAGRLNQAQHDRLIAFYSKNGFDVETPSHPDATAHVRWRRQSAAPTEAPTGVPPSVPTGGSPTEATEATEALSRNGQVDGEVDGQPAGRSTTSTTTGR